MCPSAGAVRHEDTALSRMAGSGGEGAHRARGIHRTCEDIMNLCASPEKNGPLYATTLCLHLEIELTWALPTFHTGLRSLRYHENISMLTSRRVALTLPLMMPHAPEHQWEKPILTRPEYGINVLNNGRLTNISDKNQEIDIAFRKNIQSLFCTIEESILAIV